MLRLRDTSGGPKRVTTLLGSTADSAGDKYFIIFAVHATTSTKNFYGINFRTTALPWGGSDPGGQRYLHLVLSGAGWATRNLSLPVGNLTVAVTNSYQAAKNLSTCQQLLTLPLLSADL